MFQPSPRNSLNCSAHTTHSAAARPALAQVSGRAATRSRDIRRAVARRCSGYTRGDSCSFSLLLDAAEAEVWGGGLVTVVHTCLPATSLHSACSSTTVTATLLTLPTSYVSPLS